MYIIHKTIMKTIKCPECQNDIEIPEDAKLGDTIECSHCGTECRITHMHDDHIEVEALLDEK